VPTRDGPTTYTAGQTIHLTQDGDAWADVTISKVQIVAKYDGAYSDDKPAKGHVFIQALVTYVATVNGVDYNPYDWQVFVAGEAVSDTGLLCTARGPSCRRARCRPAARPWDTWSMRSPPRARSGCPTGTCSATMPRSSRSSSGTDEKGPDVAIGLASRT
jgi:hypothetical protein